MITAADDMSTANVTAQLAQYVQPIIEPNAGPINFVEYVANEPEVGMHVAISPKDVIKK